ncbi:hypothetical protein PS3A_18920 [Pseudomonas sp. 3A(2025)]
MNIPEWDLLPTLPGKTQILTLLWAAGDNPADGEYEPVDEADVSIDTTFPLLLSVPNAALKPDGPYHLRYTVLTENDVERPSGKISLICDTTPPWDHLEPEAMSLPTAELTEEYLTANPGNLQGTLPAYDNPAVSDKVALYWLATPLPSDPVDLPDPVYFGPLNANRVVDYPRALISASLDKDYYAFYLLFDKAGNRSPISGYARIDVALGVLPDNLQDPVVPLAIAPDLLDLADAREGVTVDIRSFDNHKSTDRIEVTWGSTVLGSVEVGSLPRFPIQVPVPRLVLRDEYNRVAGGEQSTNVSYRVLRGHKPSEVKSTSIQVDFSTIGPDPQPDPDPDWPDPETPELTPARVFGRSGTPALNTLVRADGGLPADLKFDLYTPLNEGEVVDFFWGAEEVVEAVHIIQDTDVYPDEISVVIPWKYIEVAGNDPEVLVHYRIHAPGSDNYQRPVYTKVNVDAVTFTPDAPEFQGVSPRGFLNCNSLFIDPLVPLRQEPAVRVSVPDLSKFRALGEKVTLVWVALKGETGEDVVASAGKRQTFTLGTDKPLTGFTWFVEPYTTHLLPTYDGPLNPTGRGRAYYEYEDAQGETITSEVKEARVGMWDAAGTCPLP